MKPESPKAVSKSMVRANEKQVIDHEELEEHEEFWPSAKRGGAERNGLYSASSRHGVV